jgi:copper chaperone CopZ
MARASLLALAAVKDRPAAERTHDERSEVEMPIIPATDHARITRHRPSRRAGLAALFVGLALLLTACGGGASGSAAPEPAATTAQGAAADTTEAAQTTTATETGTGAATEESPEQATVTYTVPTITCPSCVARVEANAKKDPGVIDAKGDLSTQKVTVTYDPKKTDPQKIADAIRAGGDTVQPEG